MAYVYFIKSTRSNWVYVGSTSDLKRRLRDHNSGQVASTQFRKPFELIYVEEYQNIGEAREREKMIKSSRALKESLLKSVTS